jgi:hypothetical protein
MSLIFFSAENSIEIAFDEGCYQFLRCVAKLRPNMSRNFSLKLSAKILDGSIYTNEDLAQFVIKVFPAKNLFHILLGKDVNHPEKV